MQQPDLLLKTVYIDSDGACRGNPGPGGWGVVIRYKQHQKELFGGEAQTTNNRMELTAAIRALSALNEKCNVVITTDSQYVCKGITEWIIKWKRNGWAGIKNVDLWQQLDQLNQQHNVEWKWIKGHSGDKYNELADQLANQGIDQVLAK